MAYLSSTAIADGEICCNNNPVRCGGNLLETLKALVVSDSFDFLAITLDHLNLYFRDVRFIVRGNVLLVHQLLKLRPDIILVETDNSKSIANLLMAVNYKGCAIRLFYDRGAAYKESWPGFDGFITLPMGKDYNVGERVICPITRIFADKWRENPGRYVSCFLN